MLKPKLRVNRSIPPRVRLLGKRAAISVYPGKNMTKTRPITIFNVPEVSNIRGTSIREKIIMMSRSIISFLLFRFLGREDLLLSPGGMACSFR